MKSHPQNPSKNFSSIIDSYINFRVKKNKQEYETQLQHDLSCIDEINRSGKKYVVISSSNSPLETTLIMSIGAAYLKKNNHYYIINHHGAHWDTSAIQDGNFKANIKSSGTDRACGCYTILQIIFDDFEILNSAKISRSPVLQKMLSDMKKDLEAASDKIKFINDLKAESIRELISQAILNSNDTNKKIKAANILKSKYELSNEDIAAALNGLGVNYIERSQLHNVAHGFDDKDIVVRKNRIRNILAKQEGGSQELREDLYNSELSELSSFLCNNGRSDMEIGAILEDIEDGHKQEKKDEGKKENEDKKGDDKKDEEKKEERKEERKEEEKKEEEKKEGEDEKDQPHKKPTFWEEDEQAVSSDVSNKYYDAQSKRQDIRILSNAINHLEYLINPPSDDLFEHFVVLMRDAPKINQAKLHADLFSKSISKLSVKKGSIIENNDAEIPWELLRKISLIISDESDVILQRNDLITIKKSLEEVIEKELPKGMNLGSNDDGMLEIYGAPELQIEEENKETPKAKYENILFNQIKRNQFNNYIILPQIETALYEISLEDCCDKIEKLSTNIDQLKPDEINPEALLSVAALIGELSKNMLIFERYIPSQYANILKQSKDLRNAIEHMVDHEKSYQHLLQKKSDPVFIDELLKFIKKVSKAFKDLPTKPQIQLPIPTKDVIEKADNVILAIRESLPKSFISDEIFEEKLQFIKDTIVGNFEYQKSSDNANKIFGENLIALLKDGCPQLQSWKGIREGIIANIKVESDKIKKQNIKFAIQQIDILFQKLIDGGFKLTKEIAGSYGNKLLQKLIANGFEFTELNYDDKYEILGTQYQEKCFGIKKEFLALREEISRVKKEVSKIEGSIHNAENKKFIEDYNAVKSFDLEKKDNAVNPITEFCKNYKESEKENSPALATDKQLQVIINSLSNIVKLTDDLIKENLSGEKSHRKAADENIAYHQAVLFNLTMIGQIMQNLNYNEDFVCHSSLNLKKEFNNLRKIRNSIAHDQDLNITGVPSYYCNDLMPLDQIRLSGGKAYDLIEYFQGIKSTVEELSKKINASKPEDKNNKKEQESLYQKYLMKEELLSKAVSERDKESCLDIFGKINYTIKDDSRFVIRVKKHLNEIYYKNILLNDLKHFLEDKKKIDEKDLDFCKSFLERIGIDAEKKCKEIGDYYKIAREENLKRCKNYLSGLGLDLQGCSYEKDYFELVKQEIEKLPSTKDPLQIQLENALVGKERNKKCEELLRKLNLQTDGQYQWLDYCLENVKSELYRKNSETRRYMKFSFFKDGSRDVENIEESDLLDDDNAALNFFKSLHEMPKEKQISLMLEDKELRKFLLVSAENEATQYLNQAPVLKVGDLYHQRLEIEKICKNNNIIIDGVWGEIINDSHREGDNSIFFIKSASNNPHEIAKFKREFCNLFGMKLTIITQEYVQEYFEHVDKSEELQYWLEEFQKIKLHHLQNSCELHEAVSDRNVSQVKQVLEKELILDFYIGGYTPLHLACMRFNRALSVGVSPQIAQLLLKAGANPRIKDKHGNNMLHNAAQDGKMELVNMAIEYGVPLNSKNRHKETVLDMLRHADNRTEMYDFLFPLLDLPLEEKLITAIRNGDVENVIKLLPSVDVNQKTKDGELLLNIACDSSFGYERDNKLVIVNILLDAGADINAVDDKNDNALNALLEEDDEEIYEIAELLFNSGIIVNQEALDSAVHEKDSRIMELILSQNSNLDLSSPASRLVSLPYGSFERLNGTEKLKLLMAYGLDLNEPCSDGQTILEKIAESDNAYVAELLFADNEEKTTPSNSPRNTTAARARNQQEEARNEL